MRAKVFAGERFGGGGDAPGGHRGLQLRDGGFLDTHAGAPSAPASPSNPAPAPRGTASPRPDSDCHGRLRLGPARGRRGGRSAPQVSSGFRPAEKHWHGATATTAMTHIAETLDGKTVDWLQHVRDDEYRP